MPVGLMDACRDGSISAEDHHDLLSAPPYLPVIFKDNFDRDA